MRRRRKVLHRHRRKLDLKRWYKRREFVLCTSRLVRESRSEQFGYNEDAESRPESAPEPNRSRRTAFVPVPHQHASQPGEAHAGSRRHSRRTVTLFSDRMSLHTSERGRAVRNHKESRKAEEENWRKRRPTILRLHKRFDERRALDMEARKDFEKSQIECSISEHDRCERCGSLNCEKVLERDAWIVTQDFCHEVRIPLYKCLRCQEHSEEKATFHVTPIHIGAFPCTPVWAFDMERITTGHGKVVMYGYELLSFLRETVDLCPRLGIHAFAESLYARIKRHNCYIPIQEDRMRKQLTKAFHEFTVVQTHMDDPSTHCRALGVPLGECPACRGSQSHLKDIVRKKIAATGAEGVHVPQEGDGRLVIHSVYVDGHFGIPHFKAAGKSSASDPPLVKRLFSDDAVAAYLNDPATKATRNSSLSCADFSADSMVARASNQYDRSGISGLFCRHGVIIALLNMFTVQFLVAAYKRADLKYREKTEELRSIMHQAVHMKFSLAQIEEMTSNPPRLDKEVEVARSNEVEFLECTLVYEFIRDSSAILKPFVEILMGDVVANRLSLRSQYARKMKVRMERVKAKLPSNWGSQADIARATYSLWDFKLRRQEQIVVQARQRKYIVEMQLERLRNRRRDFKKLNKHVLDQGKKLRMEIDTLAKIARQILKTVHAYYGHLTGTPSIDRGAAAEAIQIAAKISWKSDGSVDSSALYNCIEEDAYPWQHASCSGLERLRAQFHAARDIQCRAMEEKDLVRAEILGAREALEAERQSVREEMARLVEHERRTELLVSDTAFQGMSQSSWESGVALMKSRLGIFENRCSIGALSAIEEETATLLQELAALHVSDHGVHPTNADGNGHQSFSDDSLSIGDYEDDGMEVEI
ncbi:hypothetical protein M9434_002482 [Picochlorum sp. BPE23]|nr:hypothetical protein M9434_002482 [Picochlorum sp. BPE23]